MATLPTPTIGRLRTPPAIQGAVVAARAVGKSKRKIAKELGIDRETVDNVLEVYQTDQLNSAETIQRELVPKAIGRIKQVIDSDTDIARYVLDNTVFRVDSGDRYLVQGNMEQHLTLLPSTAATTITPSTDVALATEAAAKPPHSDMSLSVQTNFSQFSDEQLEQELARRRSARTIDAEIIR